MTYQSKHQKLTTSYSGFGKCLTEHMRDRGFASDEQLVRKAMKLQADEREKVTIQRRTISNWRNGKSAPRSKADRGFQLVLAALDLTAEQKLEMESLIETPDLVALVEHGADAAQTGQPRIDWKWPVAGLATFGFGLIIYFAMLLPNLEKKTIFVETIPADQLHLSEDGFVLPFSDKRAIEIEDLAPLTSWDLYVARNEIFARKGRPFIKETSACLQRHFDNWTRDDDNNRGWYERNTDDLKLTDLDLRNAETIRNYECSARGGQMNCSGEIVQCR